MKSTLPIIPVIIFLLAQEITHLSGATDDDVKKDVKLDNKTNLNSSATEDDVKKDVKVDNKTNLMSSATKDDVKKNIKVDNKTNLKSSGTKDDVKKNIKVDNKTNLKSSETKVDVKKNIKIDNKTNLNNSESRNISDCEAVCRDISRQRMSEKITHVGINDFSEGGEKNKNQRNQENGNREGKAQDKKGKRGKRCIEQYQRFYDKGFREGYDEALRVLDETRRNGGVLFYMRPDTRPGSALRSPSGKASGGTAVGGTANVPGKGTVVGYAPGEQSQNSQGNARGIVSETVRTPSPERNFPDAANRNIQTYGGESSVTRGNSPAIAGTRNIRIQPGYDTRNRERTYSRVNNREDVNSPRNIPKIEETGRHLIVGEESGFKSGKSPVLGEAAVQTASGQGYASGISVKNGYVSGHGIGVVDARDMGHVPSNQARTPGSEPVNGRGGGTVLSSGTPLRDYSNSGNNRATSNSQGVAQSSDGSKAVGGSSSFSRAGGFGNGYASGENIAFGSGASSGTRPGTAFGAGYGKSTGETVVAGMAHVPGRGTVVGYGSGIHSENSHGSARGIVSETVRPSERNYPDTRNRNIPSYGGESSVARGNSPAIAGTNNVRLQSEHDIRNGERTNSRVNNGGDLNYPRNIPKIEEPVRRLIVDEERGFKSGKQPVLGEASLRTASGEGYASGISVRNGYVKGHGIGVVDAIDIGPAPSYPARTPDQEPVNRHRSGTVHSSGTPVRDYSNSGNKGSTSNSESAGQSSYGSKVIGASTGFSGTGGFGSGYASGEDIVFGYGAGSGKGQNRSVGVGVYVKNGTFDGHGVGFAN